MKKLRILGKICLAIGILGELSIIVLSIVGNTNVFSTFEKIVLIVSVMLIAFGISTIRSNKE